MPGSSPAQATGGIQLGHGVGNMQDAPAKPVDGPAHGHIEFSPDSILEHLVEGRPLVPTFGSTNAAILVGLDDLPSTMLSDLRKHATLVVGRLAIRWY